MDNWDNRQRVMRKIEHLLMNFQQMLIFGNRPAFLLPESDENDGGVLEMRSRSEHRLLCVSQMLLSIYNLLKANSYRTKRDLYYELKHIFLTQDASDRVINYTTHLLRECRFNLHIIATSKGVVIGDLSFKVSADGETIDCRSHPVTIPVLPTTVSDIVSNAAFILIAEKDSTCQYLVADNICSKLGPCIVVTAKGYPDYATRVFLHRLYSELHVPMFALMDGDPYGIDIFMMYKYGSPKPTLYNFRDISLPSLSWIGVYPTDAARLQVDESAKLPLSSHDRNKAERLIMRTAVMNEDFATSELYFLLEVGYKTEIEAVAALGKSFLTDTYLKSKLCSQYAEE